MIGSIPIVLGNINHIPVVLNLELETAWTAYIFILDTIIIAGFFLVIYIIDLYNKYLDSDRKL